MKLHIVNYSDLETVYTELVVLRGHVESTTELRRPLEVRLSVPEADTFLLKPKSIRIVQNSFSTLLQLQNGVNVVTFHVEGQLVQQIRLNHGYPRNLDTLTVKPLLVFSEQSQALDSEALIANNSKVKSYFAKIEIGLKIVQWYFSEKLAEAGFPRSCFTLEASTTFQCSLSPEAIQNMTSTQVWEALAQEIRNDSAIWSDRVKYVVFLMHPWRREAGLESPSLFALEPRSAVAGGGLVLLDHKLLATWPESVDQVFQTLDSDHSVPVEATLTPLLSTVGRVYGTSLGIVAHEMGHVFDLGHDDRGLLGRDFHHFALSLRPKLKSTLKGQTKRVYLTSGTIYEDPVQLSQAHLTLLHYNRWFQSPHREKETLKSNQSESSIKLERNLVKSSTSISVIEVRELDTARTVSSWIAGSGEAKASFTLYKRFVPREYAEKSLELLVQNISGEVFKESVNFASFPEGVAPIRRH